MDAKQILVENLYKAAEIIILGENVEDMKEIKLSSSAKGWQLTIINESEIMPMQDPKLSRQFYKNVQLKTAKRSGNKLKQKIRNP